MSDVYLIILDCLRHDFSQDMFPGMESSDKAVANFPKSLASHNALLTEKKAEEVKTLTISSKVEEDTIASFFRSEGYRTVSISTNGFFQPNYGFDDFDEHYDYENSVPFNQDRFEEIRLEEDSFKGSAKKLLHESVRNPSLILDGLVYMHKTRMPKVFRDSGLKSALSKMRDAESSEEDTFFTVNLMELHTPRTPPWAWCLMNGYKKLPLLDLRYRLKHSGNSPTVRSELEGRYHRRAYEAARDYTGQKMNEWIDEEVGDKDILVITSDHGELLGEYGLWGHCFGFTPEQFHVPFFYSGDISFNDFISLDDVYDVLVEKIGSGNSINTKDSAFFYSYEDRDVDQKWADDQKGFINAEFRQVDFRNFRNSGRGFYQPFKNEEVDGTEPVDIPDIERRENYDPDEEVKQRLEKLGYMN